MAEKELQEESILHLPVPQAVVNVILEEARKEDVYLVVKLGGNEDKTVMYVAASKENPDKVLREMKSAVNHPKGSIFASMQELAKLFAKYFGTRVRGDNDPVAE